MSIDSFSVLLIDFLFYRKLFCSCLLYTSDAADDLLCVDLGGRRIIKKKTPGLQVCAAEQSDVVKSRVA